MVAAAGSPHFSAAATSMGDLYVFSAAGRRLLPPLRLGAPAMAVGTDQGWRLVVVTTDARVRVWDLSCTQQLLEDSGPTTLTSATELLSDSNTSESDQCNRAAVQQQHQ